MKTYFNILSLFNIVFDRCKRGINEKMDGKQLFFIVLLGQEGKYEDIKGNKNIYKNICTFRFYNHIQL